MFELETIKILPPTCEEDTLSLLALLKQIDDYKGQIKVTTEKLKKIEEETQTKIKEYYIEQLRNNNKYKINSVFGNISVRNNKEWIYEDEDLIISQLEEIKPELIRIVKSIDKNAFKKACIVTTNGDVILEETLSIINGIRVIEEDKISVTIK